MGIDEAKQQICCILGEEIKFNKHFDFCFSQLKETQQTALIAWTAECKNMHTTVISSKIHPSLIGFVKKIGSNLRAILTKEKDSYFLALFLNKHKYYEAEMRRLGF